MAASQAAASKATQETQPTAQTSPETPPKSPLPPAVAALLGFANMYFVGTFYALSVIPEAIGLQMKPDYPSHNWLTAPFAAFCTSLSLGLVSASSLLTKNSPYIEAGRGTLLWGIAAAAAGYSVDQASLPGVIWKMLGGGLPVGWTYLAVVVLVSQGLPGHPLFGSAIGPLGFSSGAATVLAVRGAEQWRETCLGPFIVAGGRAASVVGVVTILCGLADPHERVATQDIHVDPSSRRFLAILLFFNALPGMVVFSALMPLAFQSQRHPVLLPCSLIALAAGGVLAPLLCRLLGGPRRVFVALFYLRGAVLLCPAISPGVVSEDYYLPALLVVLFSHGCGFSLLPAIVKAQQPSFAAFYTAYGQILPAWGAAGVAAALIHHIVGPGDPELLAFCMGVVTAVFGGVLSYFPNLGADALEWKQGSSDGQKARPEEARTVAMLC